MPSGATHDRITLWLLPWLVVIFYLITRNGELTLIIAAGYLFSSFMFGPDLDLYSIQVKRWGKLAWLWRPYQKMMTHRSILSHGFIIGTIFRIFYLSIWLICVSIILITISQMILGFSWNWPEFFLTIWLKLTQEYPQETIALFCGLEIGAMSHSCSDFLFSNYKKLQKKSKSPKKKSK